MPEMTLPEAILLTRPEIEIREGTIFERTHDIIEASLETFGLCARCDFPVVAGITDSGNLYHKGRCYAEAVCQVCGFPKSDDDREADAEGPCQGCAEELQ